jgi:hypothetical protein
LPAKCSYLKALVNKTFLMTLKIVLLYVLRVKECFKFKNLLKRSHEQLDPLPATSMVEEIKIFECLLFFLEVGNLQV